MKNPMMTTRIVACFAEYNDMIVVEIIYQMLS